MITYHHLPSHTITSSTTSPHQPPGSTLTYPHLPSPHPLSPESVEAHGCRAPGLPGGAGRWSAAAPAALGHGGARAQTRPGAAAPAVGPSALPVLPGPGLLVDQPGEVHHGLPGGVTMG